MRNLNNINRALLVSSYELKIDLIEDWNNHLNDRMLRMGYKPKKGGYDSLDYHKAMKKLIPVHPREVYYSRELSCPDECKTALSKLVLDIESGKNLLPYMSKQVINPTINDGMLNDWGIHHFHLNEDFEKDTIFIKRSDWLLLAFVNEEAVYFLNVYHHKKKYLWSHIKLIEIIYDNWPELIEKNRIEGAVCLTEKINDEIYSKLRKANATTLVEIGESRVFGLIGGGYASDGSSTDAVRTSDYWYNYIRKVELYIKDEYQNFKIQMLPFDICSMEKNLEIKLLALTEEEMILLEKQRDVIIKINYNSGKIRMCKLSSLFAEFLFASYENRISELFGRKKL